jgi:hypothetical protein
MRISHNIQALAEAHTNVPFLVRSSTLCSVRIYPMSLEMKEEEEEYAVNQKA